MLKYIVGKEKEAIRDFSRDVVNAIAQGKYNLILEKVDDKKNWSAELLSEVIECFKEDNDLEQIDCYDVECTFNPKYPNGIKYKQEDIFLFNDDSGFGYEYHLTTNGEPNDLTLNTEFVFENDHLKVIFESGIAVD
jgi:hypothetical protein